MWRWGACVASFVLALCGTVRAETQLDWAAVTAPTAGHTHIYGGYAKGCIAGAEALPESGRGYQVVRLSRNRNWGHPQLVDFLEDLGRQVYRAKLGTLAVGDLGQPRGGPMPFGHSSHQIGLDADIFYRLDIGKRAPVDREDLFPISVVNDDDWSVRSNLWGDAQGDIVRLAALDKRVERIFVNPVVKKALCLRDWPDEGRAPVWLSKVRPWWGHDGHFHVRLKCPRGEKDCVKQEAPADSTGCGAELDDWLAKLRKPEKLEPPFKKPEMRPMPPLPLQCQNVLRAVARDLARDDGN